MKTIFRLFLAGILLTHMFLWTGCGKPKSIFDLRPWIDQETDSNSLPEFIPEKAPEETKAMEWIRKPWLAADDIRPLTRESNIPSFWFDTDGLELYDLKDKYYLQLNEIITDGFAGLIDYSGALVVEQILPVREYAPFKLFPGKFLPSRWSVIFFDIDDQSYLLDETYGLQAVGGVGASGPPTNEFYWVETDAALYGDYGKHLVLPAALPARQATWANGVRETINATPNFINAQGAFGYVQQGKVVIPFEYEAAQSVWENIGAVRKGDKWYYITMNNVILNPEGYDTAYCEQENWSNPTRDNFAYNFSEGLVAVNRGGLWGYMDKTGKEVIACQYEATRPVFEGKAWVKMNGLWGVADLSAYTLPDTSLSAAEQRPVKNMIQTTGCSKPNGYPQRLWDAVQQNGNAELVSDVAESGYARLVLHCKGGAENDGATYEFYDTFFQWRGPVTIGNHGYLLGYGKIL